MVKMKEEHEAVEVDVFEINMGDVEDPDLMIAAPIYEWQQTESGKWIMENSNPVPSWHRNHDMYNYGHIYSAKKNILITRMH